jgi:uncharacterized phage infection (PIP) family protein YhgE
MTEPSSDISQQLEAPLALLKSIAERAFVPGQLSTSSQLQGQLSHLQSAVSDVLDIAATAMNELLEQVEDELVSEGAMDSARSELRELSEELQDQLGSLSDILLSARNFEELGAAREEVEGIELMMQGTLHRLEMLIDRIVDGQLEEPPLAENSRVDEASLVLELLAEAITSVDEHLVDGDLGRLQVALEQVESAGQILRLALARAEEDAVRLALARAEGDDEGEHDYSYDDSYRMEYELMEQDEENEA